jgi:hypothetical protein
MSTWTYSQGGLNVSYLCSGARRIQGRVLMLGAISKTADMPPETK